METNQTIYSTKEEVIQEFVNQGSTESLANYAFSTRKRGFKKRFLQQDVAEYLKTRTENNYTNGSIPSQPEGSSGIPPIHSTKKSDFTLGIEKYFWSEGINNYEEATIRLMFSHRPEYILSRNAAQLTCLCNEIIKKIKENPVFEKINEIDERKYCYMIQGNIGIITSKNRLIQRYYIKLFQEKDIKYQLACNTNNSTTCAEKTNKAIDDYLSQQTIPRNSSPDDL